MRSVRQFGAIVVLGGLAFLIVVYAAGCAALAFLPKH